MFSERLQILISSEQRRRLEAEAAEQGKSVAAVIREAVDARYGRPPRAERIRAMREIETMNARLPDDPAELDCMIDEGRLEEAEAGLRVRDRT